MKRCACGAPISGRARKCEDCKPNPFHSDYKPYGTYTGVRGNADQWREAFHERFTEKEIEQHLGDQSPWAVLGIGRNASKEEIQRAYRKRARETHPDLHPGIDRAEFQAVQAAYQRLGG